MKAKKVLRRILFIGITVVLLLAGAFFLYVSQYYKADENAKKIMQSEDISISKSKDFLVFHPDKEKDLKKAYIFYPGGKVEETAYAPLLQKLSREGLTCILMKMPFRLAVLM